MKKLNKMGEKSISHEGYILEIIEYRSYVDIDILIDNKYILKNKRYDNFKYGFIKNPYCKSIFDIGYIGEGRYNAYINRKATLEYRTWKGMIQRCYSQELQEKQPSYIGCTVCEEWHNFQNFAEWFNNNYYQIGIERMCLDKDILIKRNKIYSPDTCVFAPHKINTLFIKSDKMRGKYPIGVYWNEKHRKFYASLQKFGVQINLGGFNTPEKAFQIYKTNKEKYIKEVADGYKDKIPEKLYDAMYNYEIEITD